MRVVPFDPSDVIGATAHPSQSRYQFVLDKPEMFRGFWPDTYSALDGDLLVAIGGAPLIQDEYGAWVLFTDKITPARFLVVHRTAVRFLVLFEKNNDPIFAHFDPNNPAAVSAALAVTGLVAPVPIPTGQIMIMGDYFVDMMAGEKDGFNPIEAFVKRDYRR